MKAIVADRFGPPDILHLADAEPPAIGPGEVLVRVHAAALNPYDWHMLRGDPRIARVMPGGAGLRRPRHRVAGIDAAGTIEKIGPNVSGLSPGDEVFGFCPGAFAEYARATAAALAPKPARLTFQQAAAVPMAATTALRGITQTGRVRAGQRVLVNGAAGGVGTFAVQLAAARGAEVTGVCRAGNADLVRSLGAAHVIDYAKTDFTDGGTRYDVILDNVGNQPLRRLRRALTPDGTLVVNAGGSPGRVFGAVGAMARAAAANAVVRQHLRILPARQDGAELAAVARLIEDGTLTPVVDRTYPLAAVADGLRHIEQGHARGKAVVLVTGLTDDLDRARPVGAEDLLQGHVQELEALQLTGPLERPGIDRPQPAGGGQVRDRLLGARVVPGDEHVQRRTARPAAMFPAPMMPISMTTPSP
jgi:NADPH:quinone reductase-like Zn-dependent oxidoreductase